MNHHHSLSLILVSVDLTHRSEIKVFIFLNLLLTKFAVFCSEIVKLPKMLDRVKFVVAATGIFFTYFFVGILQEQITKGSYKNSKKFEYAFVLVGVQFIWNFIVARGWFSNSNGFFSSFILRKLLHFLFQYC